MARDGDGIIQEKFAASGDVGLGDLVIDDGWPIAYSTPGGKDPQRLQFNQLYRFLFALAKEINQKGPFLEYDATIDYAIGAGITATDGNRYKALLANGPATSVVSPIGNPATWEEDDLSLLAPLASPALTGNPTAPTQAVGNNSTRLATTAFVQAKAPLAGSVVGGDFVVDGEVNTGSNPLPSDNSIPEITEGDEYMTLSYTPTKSTNKLKIEVVAMLGSTNTVSQISAALFKNSTTNALAAALAGRASFANARTTVVFTHHMIAGTTSPIIFRVRGGSASAGTTTFNGVSGGRTFGGVASSSITITETEA